MDQFKKIASNKTPAAKTEVCPIKSEEKKEEKNYETGRSERDRKWYNDKARDWENRRERRRNDSRWGRSADRRHSSSSSPSPTRRRTSPGPDARHVYHQPPPNVSHVPRPHFNQQQQQQYPPPNLSQSPVTSLPPSSSSSSAAPSIPPLMSQPIMQMTNLPPPNIRGIAPPTMQLGNIHRMPPPPKNLMNTGGFVGMDGPPHVGNPPRVPHNPPHHVLRAPPPPPPSMPNLPPNTNVPPPGMQIPQNGPPPPHNMQSMPPTGQCPPQHMMQPQQQCNIPPPSGLGQPPNIPPPNLPPPNIMPPMSQIPPNIMPINNQAIVVTVASVTNVPPPNVVPQMIMSGPPPPVHNATISSTINTIPPPNLNVPPPNVLPPPNIIQNSPPPHLMPTSYPVQHPPQVPITVGTINMQLPPPVRPPHSLQPRGQLGMILARS